MKKGERDGFTLVVGLLMIFSGAPLPSQGVLPAQASTLTRGAPALAAQSTFTTRFTSRWLVSLPKDIDANDVSTNFDGGGRVSGFFVAKADKAPKEGLMLYGNTVGRCKHRGCRGHPPYPKFTYRVNLADTLHAGLYHVYVVADATNVTFDLELQGLSGSRDFTRGQRVGSVITTLRGRLSGDNQRNVYSAGQFLDVQGFEPEFGLLGIWADGSNHLATRYGDCYYYPGNVNKPPNEDIAFLPGCPSGDGFEHTFVSERPLEDAGFVYVSSNRAGPDAIGGWFTSVSMPEKYGAVAAWIDFAPIQLLPGR